MLNIIIKKKPDNKPATKPQTVRPGTNANKIEMIIPSGNKIDLGTIQTEKKPQNALLANINANKVKETSIDIPKKISYLDNVIPGMFVEDDYICHIKKNEVKGRVVTEYDWKLKSRNATELQIPVCKFYIDSEGDLHLTGRIDENRVYHRIIFNDENMAMCENIANNSTNDNVTRRRSTSIDTSMLVEICSISYNDWQKISKTTLDVEGEIKSFTDYIHYDRRDHQITKSNGEKGIRYEGALMCVEQAYDYFVVFIDNWIKKQEKETSILFTK
jgi:hypothetical protein